MFLLPRGCTLHPRGIRGLRVKVIPFILQNVNNTWKRMQVGQCFYLIHWLIRFSQYSSSCSFAVVVCFDNLTGHTTAKNRAGSPRTTHCTPCWQGLLPSYTVQRGKRSRASLRTRKSSSTSFGRALGRSWRLQAANMLPLWPDSCTDFF